MRWRIYYGDGSTYGPDEPPEGAPALDVQVIAWDHPIHGRQIMWGQHFYWWNPNSDDIGWWAGDMFGLFDYLAHFRGWKLVLTGRSIRDSDFEKIKERALTERW